MYRRTELDFADLLSRNCNQNHGKQDQSNPLWKLLTEVNPEESGRNPKVLVRQLT